MVVGNERWWSDPVGPWRAAVGDADSVRVEQFSYRIKGSDRVSSTENTARLISIVEHFSVLSGEAIEEMLKELIS